MTKYDEVLGIVLGLVVLVGGPIAVAWGAWELREAQAPVAGQRIECQGAGHE